MELNNPVGTPNLKVTLLNLLRGSPQPTQVKWEIKFLQGLIP